MKRSVLHLALALSLLFNGFFLIGYLQGRQFAAAIPADERVAQLVMDELHLTDTQQQVYRELRANMRDAVHDLESQLAQVQFELIDAVNQPSPDFVEILRLMDQKTLLDQERVGVASRHFGEFVRSLTPSQRAELKRRIERGGWRIEPPQAAPQGESIESPPDEGFDDTRSGGGTSESNEADHDPVNDFLKRLGDQSSGR